MAGIARSDDWGPGDIAPASGIDMPVDEDVVVLITVPAGSVPVSCFEPADVPRFNSATGVWPTVIPGIVTVPHDQQSSGPGITFGGLLELVSDNDHGPGC